MRNFDICIITAANDRQAQGYRKQVEWRKSKGVLSEETEFLIYADPHGKRVGSGGSTIYVLNKLLERSDWNFDKAFRNKRILILHSGGDSRRLPAYSAIGKVFAPLPTKRFFALFDVLLNNFTQLPYLDDGQVIVASGDVLLSFEPSHVAFSNTGVTGVAYPDFPDVASNHGVYVVSSNHSAGNPVASNPCGCSVIDFLQKPSLDQLQSANALGLSNRAFVDTGIMSFALDAVERLVNFPELNEEIAEGDINLDLYREFTFAMVGKTDGATSSTLNRYKQASPRCYEQASPPANRSEDVIMSTFATELQEIPFSVSLLPYCDFFHVGKSREFLENFYTLTHASVLYDFHNFTRSNVQDYPQFEDAFVYNTLINTDYVEIGESILIEGCYLEGKLKLEGENILTGVPEGAGDIVLKRGICLTLIPIEGGNWASVIYGINDNFKFSIDDDECSFLNTGFSEWMKKHNVSQDELYDTELQAPDDHSLWNAQLFPVSDDPAKAIQMSLLLQNDDCFIEPWKSSRRMSLKEVLRSADHKRLLERYLSLDRKSKLINITEALTSDNELPSEEIISWCQEQEDYVKLAEKVVSMIEQSKDLLFQARLYKLLSNLTREVDHSETDIDEQSRTVVSAACPRQRHDQDLCPEALEDRAFELICEAIGRGAKRQEGKMARGQRDSLVTHQIQIRSDEVVWACTPARLDFAGGWSDTPPYCLERGGSVLNAAVKLNGQYPIQAIGKIYSEPVIRMNSIDLEESVVISDMSEMLSFSEPGQWLSLPKSAFVASGIISQDEERSLRDILEEFGGGIDLTLFSAVPSGSGLGTSSILGSAIIACLSRMFGIELTQDDLFNRTLYMEQLMTTGGGWQDQIGGVVGGVKLIQTEPGLFQSPNISWTELKQSNTVHSGRFLLYYTGYRRMAKNILQQIVGRYLDRDKITLETIGKLREISADMKDDLDHRDISAFGWKVGEVWELNKTLDPGTSNEKIEAILDKISDYIYGAKLLGAGGGGFLFIVAKDANRSQKIKQILTENPPNARARFFDFDVDPDGLKVSVL